jgi:hypothetical protein
VTLKLSPLLSECCFTLLRPEGKEEVALEQAQCFLVVLPTLTADGRTCLRFTPTVEYGEPVRRPVPAPDRSDWTLEVGKQNQSYPDLGWEVTLAPNEYLVIGACFDRSESLGHRAFVDQQGEAPVQRLLVLRTSRSGAGVDAEIAEAVSRGADPGAAIPLALQATLPSAHPGGP